MSDVKIANGRAFFTLNCEFCDKRGEVELSVDDYTAWQMGKSVDILFPEMEENQRYIMRDGHCKECADDIERLARENPSYGAQRLEEIKNKKFEILVPEKFEAVDEDTNLDPDEKALMDASDPADVGGEG